MNFESLLVDLGRETGINLSAAAQSGSCTIEFSSMQSSSTLAVTFEATDLDGVAQSLLHMHVVIGPAPLVGGEKLYARLMQIHMLGLATDQAIFSYDAELRQIILFRSLPLAPLGSTQALSQVESFVNQAERWRDHLPALMVSPDENFSVSDFSLIA